MYYIVFLVAFLLIAYHLLFCFPSYIFSIKFICFDCVNNQTIIHYFSYVDFSLLILKHVIFLKRFFYLFLERGEGKEKERERNISVWLPLTCPHWGPDPQPRHMPWLGIKPATLWFAGQCSIHWATPARVKACTFWQRPISKRWRLSIFLSFA